MRIALAQLSSASPYSPGRAVQTKKDRDETHDEHEERTWRERAHADQNGVFIPPMAFKNCVAEAAKYKGIQIPGKGKERYTKHFEAGVMCKEPLHLGMGVDDLAGNRLFLPADGKRGGSKRVWKTFPIIHEWQGEVEFLVLDEVINNDVFEQHLIDAGQFIGIGTFRPRNNGYFGRFEVIGITWKKL